MAACKIKIEIDEPSRVRVGGETVTGHVIVTADDDVNCKSLDVTCCWMTHGRGNVARGDAETQSLYQGHWQSGQEYRYPFKLKSATWPPTYYGTYLNVGHYIEARAKLPWKLDPKDQQEFPLIALETPADLTPTQIKPSQARGVGWVVGVLVAGLFLVAFLPLLFILLPIVGVVGGLFWFFRVFLPRQITGPVELVVEPELLSSGESLSGRFDFTPKTNTNINGIRWTIRCVEKCVSGSGSNRTTHTHEVLSKEFVLSDSRQLVSGQPQRHELGFTLPASAPPSLKFTDNEVSWASEIRIDIPRWPDWVKQIPFVVKASASNMSVGAMAPTNANPIVGSSESPVLANVVSPASDDDPWLTEVLQQILHSENDDKRLAKILGALSGQEFAIRVDTQGEVDEPLDSDIEVESSWIAAVDKTRNVRLALCIPQDIEAQSLLWLNDWQAVAVIHGFDSETGRVMMQVLRLQ